MVDHHTAPISSEDRAMLDYAVKLTRTPQTMTRDDVEALRTAGFSDAAISHIAQVTALFNYYNRIADGLGIEPEPDW
ncbi:MAG: peroxidase [Deltaproteobacteria bacterium]|nr:peroxidase [Deltaproteobacteria bacterium]